MHGNQNLQNGSDLSTDLSFFPTTYIGWDASGVGGDQAEKTSKFSFYTLPLICHFSHHLHRIELPGKPLENPLV